MKKFNGLFMSCIPLLLGLWLALLICPANALAASGKAAPPLAASDNESLKENLREVIREIERKYTGESAEGTMIMQVTTRHYTRKMRMQYWSKGRERFLVSILYPAKDEGISTLKVCKEIWNYLPKVDRVIKIPASMMGGAWMGSHITNDDLVKESQVADDYTFRLLDDSGGGVWAIEAIPKPEAAVVWGKLIYEIIMPDLIPRQISYFDEEEKKVRIIRYSDVQDIDDRKIPLKMEVLPLEKPKESTTMIYEKIRFGVSLKDDFFSLRNLKKR